MSISPNSFESVNGFVRRYKLIFICFLITYIVLLMRMQSSAVDKTVVHFKVWKEKISDKLTSFRKDSRMLENILKASYQPPSNGKSIFFIESHTKEDKVLALTTRQACSVEAAGDFF